MIDLINMRLPGFWVPCFLTGRYLEFGTATPTPHQTLPHHARGMAGAAAVELQWESAA